jgi:hypothetical protein
LPTKNGDKVEIRPEGEYNFFFSSFFFFFMRIDARQDEVVETTTSFLGLEI